MRRLGAIIVLLAATTTSIAGADTPQTEEAPSIPWYRWLFLGERAPANSTAQSTSKRVDAKTATTPAPRESGSRSIIEEQKTYVKRLAAISQIKKIADEQGDEKTLKNAELLEKQLNAQFEARFAKLKTADTLDDDKAALERTRDDKGAKAERTPPRRRPGRGDDQ